MYLSKLIANLKNQKIIGDVNINIKSLNMNSKIKKPHCIFFCIDGTKTNAIMYLDEAIKNGAVCAVVNKKYYDYCKEKFNKPMLNNKRVLKGNQKYINKITFVFVSDVRKAMAVISANFFNNPQKQLKIVGITGTNGKTSCSYLIAGILKGFGKKVGIIGTSGVYIGQKKYDANMTTPDSIELFEIFSKMVKAKIEYCIMEVSAHAIFYNKIFGINFSVKALTNVKSDHLDFFKTERNYANVKQSFFNKNDLCILNNDDKIGEKLSKKCKNLINFGKKHAIFKIFNIKLDIGKTQFKAKYKDNIYSIKTNLTGLFNVYNISLAICCALCLGFNIEKIIEIVKCLKSVDGRFDVVFKNENLNIIIDYAHTSDSLKNVLETAKKISPNKNIIVFGCPGERDTKKRFFMGKLATKFCDVVIFTSDNPASENPKRIMFEMEEGLKSAGKQTEYYKIEDRYKAIKKSISISKKIKQSNILIVGKGTENYQIVGNKKIQYCDYEAVKSILNDNKINLQK